jgi:hypothetical protein
MTIPRGGDLMHLDQYGIEPFDPAANPADHDDAFLDDDREDQTVEDGAPAPELPDDGGGLDG